MPFEIDESNIRQTRVREKQVSSHQFDLKFLLILFTFAVIVAAFLQLSFLSDGLAKSESPKQISRSLSYSFATAIISSVLGAILGCFIERRWQACVTGFMVGLCVGEVAGLLGTIRHEYSMQLNQIAFVGSMIVIIVLLLIARSSSLSQNVALRKDTTDRII